MSNLRIVYNSSYIKDNELVFIILLVAISVMMITTFLLVKKELKNNKSDK